MTGFPPAELQTLIEMYDEPIAALSSDENWWRLGIVDVSKKYPTYRVGFGTTMTSQTHFFLQPFRFDSLEGVAVVLATGGKMPFQFAGWVPPNREAEARGWVATLNRSIESVLPTSSGKIADTDALLFETGFHPNQFGMERVELGGSGQLDYEQKLGTLTKRVSGTFNPAKFHEVIGSLVKTTFPVEPQATLVPGASMIRITALPLNQSVVINYFEALRMTGYKELVTALQKLIAALRDSRTQDLAEWGFATGAS